ncbi:hypothetical protein [Sporomusa sp.]|uniref:hypothetical protein n=1 Tax=Sporomusa sp. TaxID=2078658 RepID=UPI002CA50B46|nr:hypothetical protein [Sporomusa sp.]HWR09602.1 hypothetical protein [Sporomusa sp.]
MAYTTTGASNGPLQGVQAAVEATPSPLRVPPMALQPLARLPPAVLRATPRT